MVPAVQVQQKGNGLHRACPEGVTSCSSLSSKKPQTHNEIAFMGRFRGNSGNKTQLRREQRQAPVSKQTEPEGDAKRLTAGSSPRTGCVPPRSLGHCCHKAGRWPCSHGRWPWPPGSCLGAADCERIACESEISRTRSWQDLPRGAAEGRGQNVANGAGHTKNSPPLQSAKPWERLAVQ